MSLLELYETMKNQYTHDQGFTDKGLPYHTYIEFYEKCFSPFRNKPVSLLEIGVNHGGSLEMWKKYFSQYTLMGVDLAENPIKDKPYIESLTTDPNITLKFGRSSTDPAVAKEVKNGTFDFIIDDGSHEYDVQVETFKVWAKKVKKGGVYFIEDILGSKLFEPMKNELQAWCDENKIKIEFEEYHGDKDKISRFDDIILVVKM